MGFVALTFNNNKSDPKPFSREEYRKPSERGVLKQKEAMDENEFRRVLNLFPIVRSRDYHAESELSRESTSRATTDDVSEWQDAWGEEDKKETESQGVDQDDPFWEKLKLAAERKVGAAEAEKFCRAFQAVHKKLVCEELRKDATPSYKNLSSLD